MNNFRCLEEGMSPLMTEMTFAKTRHRFKPPKISQSHHPNPPSYAGEWFQLEFYQDISPPSVVNLITYRRLGRDIIYRCSQ